MRRLSPVPIRDKPLAQAAKNIFTKLKFGFLLFVFCLSAIIVYTYTRAYPPAYAATSSTFNFQARLMTGVGSIVPDGYYNVQFKLYDGGTQGGPAGPGAANAGTNLWTETYYDSDGAGANPDNRVQVKAGYLTVNLGSQTAFPGTINWDQELWLTMNIGGTTHTATPTWDGEMLTPTNTRIKLTAVPYAFKAAQAMLAESLAITGGSITGDSLAQLAPGALQDVMSSNAALRINQTGLGGLLQLQGNGLDVFTVSGGGDVAAAGGLSLGSSAQTVAGTLRWTGVDFEGYTGLEWVSLTSGGGTSGLVANQQTIVKTTNETLANSATLQDDNELTFPVGANETWAFRFVVQANAGTQPDIKFAVTAPTGATCSVGVADSEGAVSVGNLGCGASSGSIAGNGTADVYEVVGSVANGATAGNVTLQWAQNAANATAITVYAGSFLTATSTDGASGSSGTSFEQGGNAFAANAILGTTDNYGLNFITNGILRMSIANTGAVNILDSLTTADALTVSAGGANISGDSTINGTLTGLTGFGVTSGGATISGGLTITDAGLVVNAGGANITGNTTIDGILQGLTGLEVVSGGASIAGGLDLGSDGIANAGAIAGASSLSGLSDLVVQSGGSGSLTLGSGSGLIILDAGTLRRDAAGTTGLELNDSADTLLQILNPDASAVANLGVEGIISAAGFSGSGAGLTSLSASNIGTGTLSDDRLSSNVGLLGTAQTYTARQTFSNGLVLGSSIATTGALRWSGTDFEGYNGVEWVSLTSGGGGLSTGNVLRVVKIADETVNNSNTLQDDDELLFPIEANETVAFRFVIQANADTVADLQFAITAPSGAVCRVGYSDAEGSSSAGQLGCGVSLAPIPGNSAADIYEITGTVLNGAVAGTIALQWAQATATAQDAVVYAGSYGIAYNETAAPSGPVSNVFEQGGNAFGGTALLGTTDAQAMTFITNGTQAMTIDTAGNVTIEESVTIDAGLDVLAGGASIAGGLDLGGDGLTNAGAITGANSISGTGALIISSGLAGDLTLDSASGALQIASDDTVLRRVAAGDFTIDLNDSTDTTLSLTNNGGGAATLNLVDGSLQIAGVAVLSNGRALQNITGLSASGTIALESLASGGLIKANIGTGDLSVATAGADYEVPIAFSNGLTRVANSVTLGGSLNAATDIGLNSNSLTISGSGGSVFTAFAAGGIEIKADSTTALIVAGTGGLARFSVDSTGNLVQIGSSAADGVAILSVLDSYNGATDPSGVNGAQYYNAQTNKFRCYQDGAWVDCVGTRQLRSFVDTTVDAVVDADTTNYWDLAAENNNSHPSLTPSTTNKAITGTIVLEINSSTTQDRSVITRLERGIGAVPTCGTGTVVGSRISTFTTNSPELSTAMVMFVDAPATTSEVFYALCSDSLTNSAGGVSVQSIRITLEEANNTN